MTPISICSIMKNEEKNIEKFLSSIKNAFSGLCYEIVLVDTGSADKTLEIVSKVAKDFSKDTCPKINIHHFTWVNDFSKARNYALSLCSYDYVLVLDVDEFVKSADTSFIDVFLSQTPDGLGLIKRINLTQTTSDVQKYTDNVPRFFNRKLYKYDSPIHEQVVPVEARSFARVLIPVTVSHAGYIGSEEEVKKKVQRNISMLEELNTKESDPYILFQIGQSYCAVSEYQKACEYFAKALEFDLDTRLDYVRMCVVAYGNALLECDRIEDALSFENVYEEFSDYPEYVLMMGNIYLKAGLLENAVEEFLKATTFETAATEGVNTFLPLYNLGCINEVLGNIEDAIKLYEKCGDYAPAKERIILLTSGN